MISFELSFQSVYIIAYIRCRLQLVQRKGNLLCKTLPIDSNCSIIIIIIMLPTNSSSIYGNNFNFSKRNLMNIQSSALHNMGRGIRQMLRHFRKQFEELKIRKAERACMSVQITFQDCWCAHRSSQHITQHICGQFSRDIEDTLHRRSTIVTFNVKFIDKVKPQTPGDIEISGRSRFRVKLPSSKSMTLELYYMVTSKDIRTTYINLCKSRKPIWLKLMRMR